MLVRKIFFDPFLFLSPEKMLTSPPPPARQHFFEKQKFEQGII